MPSIKMNQTPDKIDSQTSGAKLILLRHASRENGPSTNPGLNAQGRNEAALLVDRLKSVLGQNRTTGKVHLYTSPKRRAIETLAPLSQALSSPADIQPALDERRLDESAASFQERVATTLEHLAKTEAVTIVCTHADWLEYAFVCIKADFAGFACAEFRVLNLNAGRWSSPV